MAGEAIQMAYVDQFSKNLNILSQQQGSKLRKAVRTEEIHGKRGFFDGIGSTQAQKRGATWSDTNTLEDNVIRLSNLLKILIYFTKIL